MRLTPVVSTHASTTLTRVTAGPDEVPPPNGRGDPFEGTGNVATAVYAVASLGTLLGGALWAGIHPSVPSVILTAGGALASVVTGASYFYRRHAAPGEPQTPGDERHLMLRDTEIPIVPDRGDEIVDLTGLGAGDDPLVPESPPRQLLIDVLVDGEPQDAEGTSAIAPRTELLAACLQGDAKEIRRLLKIESADVSAPDENGRTPLHFAVKSGNYDAVEALIEAGASVNARQCGFTPLSMAATDGYDMIVSRLLMARADGELAASGGDTPLMNAALKGHSLVVTLLLIESRLRGWSIDTHMKGGYTALHCACEAGNRDVARLLIGAGADVTLTDDKGRTPCDLALEKGHGGFEAIFAAGPPAILPTRIDPKFRKARTKDEWSFLRAARDGRLDKVEKLLRKGKVDIDCASDSGATALNLACENGHERIVRGLLEARANVDLANSKGVTPLIFAAERGYPEIVKLLLGHKPDLERVDPNGNTALSRAVANGHNQIVAALVDAGAKADRSNAKGATPLHLAASKGHYHILGLLLRTKAVSGKGIDTQMAGGYTALHMACLAGHREIAQFLILAGADVTLTDDKGRTPRDIALETGIEGFAKIFAARPPVPQRLGPAPAKLQIEASPAAPRPELLEACRRGDAREIQRLLDAGKTDISAADGSGRTPLHLAVASGNADAVRALIRAGAALDANLCGFTPLHTACDDGNLEIARELSKAGAKGDMPAAGGITPIDLALKRGHIGIAALLEPSSHSLLAKGRKALLAAAEVGDLQMVKYVVDQHGIVDWTREDGSSALSLAARNGRTEVVDFLLEAGATVDLPNSKGVTPLMFAAQEGYPEIVKLLIARNANIDLIGPGGVTALSLATGNGHEQVATLLWQAAEKT